MSAIFLVTSFVKKQQFPSGKVIYNVWHFFCLLLLCISELLCCGNKIGDSI